MDFFCRTPGGSEDFMDAYLFCESGDVFKGQAFGAPVDAFGELVFSTTVVGWPEEMSDARFSGQIVCSTFPVAGNYGVVPEAGKPALAAYIVRDVCGQPSNSRSEGTIDEYMTKNGVPGLCGVDTRRLTRLIRAKGPMNAIITRSRTLTPEQKARLASHEAFVPAAPRAPQMFDAPGGSERIVAMLDFGEPGNIVAELNKRGCGVAALGWDTPADVLLDGAGAVVLSGGPGDPHAYGAAIETVRELLKREIPLLGFGLGHQIMALAAGGECYRMPCGHRGGNQPVRDTATGRVRISSQNHGWAVAGAFDGARVAFVNINDDTVEGLRYTDIPALSLQFFPSTAGGPDDMSFIYDEFLKGVC